MKSEFFFSLMTRRVCIVFFVLMIALTSLQAVDQIISISDTVYSSSGETVIEIALEAIEAGGADGNGVVIDSGADVAFIAGERVSLKPGFSVNPGASFTATTSKLSGQTINEDTDWSGVRYLGGTTVVSSGADLYIDTDCILYFLPGAALEVEGDLIVGEGVRLTSTYGSGNGSTDDFWKGIVITSGTALLNKCLIEYALQGILVDGSTNTVHIQGVTFHQNLIGLHILNFASVPIVDYSLFDSNIWYGIKEDSTGDASVTNTRFLNNGILYYELSQTILSIDELNNQSGNSGNTEG
ncbi:3-coathanger stack domain-containing protein [Marispirochaeta sp.]|uniref:3-coathanger stack domain-containing protein n=1 Tax=Marispirochaeta sp. TaxID=2038653 RepID=UPI0029C5FC63|nr:3-coathanger stack domain-containing protein [Marispirochaeta sp.]